MSDAATDRPNAWYKWGEDDEAGALNYVGTQQVLEAVGLVRTGQVIRLAQPLSPKTPVPKHRCGLQHFMVRDGGDYAAGAKRPGGFQFADDTVIMPTHIGTHIDALCHAWYDDQMYNGYLGNTVRSTTGAAKLGIDKMPPAVTRGVLLDIVKLRGRKLAIDEIITREDLQAACEQAKITLRAGDAVLVHTGWLEENLGKADISFNEEPGIDAGAALWLAEQQVCLVGADNYAVEVLPFAPGTVFPVHQCLIRDFGVPLLEGLQTEPLAKTGRSEFLFVAAALPIVGATGSPLTPLAII